jgi:hypothetical protein
VYDVEQDPECAWASCRHQAVSVHEQMARLRSMFDRLDEQEAAR